MTPCPTSCTDGTIGDVMPAFGWGALLSALGQKQTFELALEMSALPPKADILRDGADVR